MTQARELCEKAEKMSAEFTEQAKELLKQFHKTIFDSYPTIEAVRWPQYAPYFNDGSPCEFSVHEPEVLLSGTENFDFYPEDKSAREACDVIASMHSELKSPMRTAFGDDKQITLRRNGDVEIEDYDHD